MSDAATGRDTWNAGSRPWKPCPDTAPHPRHEWLDGVKREDCPGVSAAQDRFSAYREKAERRGRIRHPEGDRYETPDWLDVLVLLDENDRLVEEVAELKKRLGYPEFAR